MQTMEKNPSSAPSARPASSSDKTTAAAVASHSQPEQAADPLRIPALNRLRNMLKLSKDATVAQVMNDACHEIDTLRIKAARSRELNFGVSSRTLA